MKKNAIMRDLVNQLKKIFAQDLYFYSFLIFLVILIGQLPIVLHYFHCPKGYYYPLLDKITADDYYYLSLIRYGMGSSFLTKLPHVVAEHKASLIQVFFIWLGKLALVTGLGPAEMLAIFRVIGGLVFVGASILFLRTILNKSQARLAFIFFLFAQPLIWFNDGLFTRAFGVWIWIWHFGEAARRISVIPPHYTLGKGLTILSLVFFIRGQTLAKKRLTPLFIASVLIFIAGIIYPPPVFIVLFSLGVALVFYLLASFISPPRRSPFGTSNVPAMFDCGGHLRGVLSAYFSPRSLLALTIFLVGSILPLLILKAELAKGHPWSIWNKIELGWNDPSMNFEWDYLRMLGVLVLLVPFSLSRVFRFNRLSYLRVFTFFWCISAFLLFPFADLMRVGKFRFTEGAQIVPMAVLAVWGSDYLLKMIRKFIGNRTSYMLAKTFMFLFIAYFVGVTSHVALNLTLNLWPNFRNIYFHPDELKALSFLSQRAKDDSIVLATQDPSLFIPVFAQVRTIIGFSSAFPNSADFQYEKLKIEGIIKAQLLEEEVKDYFFKRSVDYVYYDTFGLGEKVLYSSLLESVFKNKSFEIYKVKEIK